jgi:hypothetical protein
MDDNSHCLASMTHERVEYSHTEWHTDIFVCLRCGKEFEEKMDSSG